jgi:hypothetical protein
MTELSDLIHAYGIFLGAYFSMVVVVCIVLILVPWGCDCECHCECGDDDDRPFGFEERDRCPAVASRLRVRRHLQVGLAPLGVPAPE